MARKRGPQRGYLHKQGTMWCLAYREDALDENGDLVRERRTVRIASVKEVSKREARRLADEILGTVNATAILPSSLITLGEFIEKKFKPNVMWSLKPSGKKHYAYILDHHLIPALGNRRLRDIDSDDIQALVKTKVEDEYSVQTAVHIRNAASAVFNHAKTKKAYLGDNPVIGVRLPEMKRKEAHALSFEQAKLLMEHLKPVARQMTLLSITTGMNVAEMLGLCWKYVNLAETTVIVGTEVLPPFCLMVRENFYRGERCSVKAKSRQRTVPLSKVVVAELSALKARSHHTAAEDTGPCQFLSVNPPPTPEVGFRIAVT